MNGLPIGIDLAPLVGREITQICIGEHQLILNCDRDVSIAVESTCLYSSASGTLAEIANYSEEASRLCGLIGAQVAVAVRDTDGGLILSFVNGARLQIMNSNREYESFQVHVKEHIYVA